MNNFLKSYRNFKSPTPSSASPQLPRMSSYSFEKTVTVNGNSITVEVEFENDKEISIFPTLYKIDKLGRTSMWRIYVIDDQYFRESGLIDGKVKEYAPVTAVPKNVGRSNETTAEEQALFEAFSAWKHKKDQLYTEGVEKTEKTGSAENSEVGERLRPMLAEKWTDRKGNAKFPGAVSPKLDGVRVMIYKNSSGETVMISRLGKEYQHMNGIRQEARKVIDAFDVVLDGELYSHNTPFNAISGAIRSQTKPSKYDNLLEYYVFDLWVPSKPNLTYKERMVMLRKICGSNTFQRLRFLFYEEVTDEKEISEKHSQYVADGYEGLMFRNLDSKYTLGRRVDDLLKYKEFEDKEFQVVDVVEGSGTEAGAAIFVCKTSKGTRFNVRPRGSIEKRKQQLKDKQKYIGKYLTVRYQPLNGQDGVPRFPVGIKFDKTTEELAVISNDLPVGVDIRDYE